MSALLSLGWICVLLTEDVVCVWGMERDIDGRDGVVRLEGSHDVLVVSR